MAPRIFALIFFGLGFICDHVAWPATAAEITDPHNLWYAAAPPQTSVQPPEPPKPWVLRSRDIALNTQLFKIVKDAAARPHPRITVELFDGARYDLDITSTVSRIDGTAMVRGKFKPPAQGNFTFAGSDALLTGTIHIGDRLYKIEHVANGRLRLLEVNPGKLPPD